MNRIATAEPWLVEGWPDEYCYEPSSSPQDAPTATQIPTPTEAPSMPNLYRYTDYSTRRDERAKGRLMLNLANVQTGEIFTAFFNCNITYQRGAERGKYFITGRSGRFWLLPGSKFAHLWRQAVGEPERWSTIYRQMKHLKSVAFGGQVNHGKSYKENINLKVSVKL